MFSAALRQRVAIDNVARLERALRDLAICCVVAIPTSRQDINDISRVRVHLLLATGWQDSFEDADTIVLESDAYRLGIDNGRILSACRCDPRAESERGREGEDD
jgi:hypothetical protein